MNLATADPDKNEPAKPRRLMNMAADGYATNQTVTLPWFAGEEATPVLWLGEAYDQFTKAAPVERPGKK